MNQHLLELVIQDNPFQEDYLRGMMPDPDPEDVEEYPEDDDDDIPHDFDSTTAYQMMSRGR